VWRASLENPHTGQRIGFAVLEGLFEFVRRQAGIGTDPLRDTKAQ
jgi:hypothetical protein